MRLNYPLALVTRAAGGFGADSARVKYRDVTAIDVVHASAHTGRDETLAGLELNRNQRGEH